MRLQICHLSDIHFWTQEDYIDEKKKKYVMQFCLEQKEKKIYCF